MTPKVSNMTKEEEMAIWCKKNKNNRYVLKWIEKNPAGKKWVENGHTDLEWAFTEMPLYFNDIEGIVAMIFISVFFLIISGFAYYFLFMFIVVITILGAGFLLNWRDEKRRLDTNKRENKRENNDRNSKLFHDTFDACMITSKKGDDTGE